MILIQLQPALVQTQRSYAAPATKGIKPPITIHTLEGTYASALFSSSAQNAQTLNDIEKSLMTMLIQNFNRLSLILLFLIAKNWMSFNFLLKLEEEVMRLARLLRIYWKLCLRIQDWDISMAL